MNELAKKLQLFQNDCKQLKSQHYTYLKSCEKMTEEQSQCVKSVKHCRTFLRVLRSDMGSLKKTATADQMKQLDETNITLQKMEYMFGDIEDTLPRSPGIYLRVVIGAIDISFSNKEDKFTYKNDYERFKIVVSGISALLAFVLYFYVHNRILDAIFHFLLVWYYCTLTIRERILIANGSRIKGWWNIYHFFSTACACLMLIWPASQSYDEFRDQFMFTSLYLNIVHCVQYHYQTGSLYKLKALGSRHPMDITIDGFMSWMFRQLTFLLPFLFLAYALEFVNVYKLFVISRQPYCREWHVWVVAAIYLIIALGNTVTMCMVVKQKLLAPPPPVLRDRLPKKYSLAAVHGSNLDLIAHQAGDH